MKNHPSMNFPAPTTLDLDALRLNLLRQRQPSRVQIFEHGFADEPKEELDLRFGLSKPFEGLRGTPEFLWRLDVAVQQLIGSELMRVWLPGAEFSLAGSKGITWGEEHAGPIQTWEDLEKYAWPKPENIDWSELEWHERNLPDNMGIIHVVKVWEVVRELLGFETFCFMIEEDPALVDEVIRRVGEFHMALARGLCGFRSVFAVYAADDYGYKTSTMFAPQLIVEKFLPWHRRMSAHAHEHGKMYFFHSCGKVDAVMDALIDDVGIDAKHSFEDTVVPVTEAKRLWGRRVGLLGGLDVDFIVRSDEAAIRRRVRETLDICQPGGGYCLGLGNWVTSYIPVDNYLAVLDEARRYA
jgi:uroporphyrinogen decarboxylase